MSCKSRKVYPTVQGAANAAAYLTKTRHKAFTYMLCDGHWHVIAGSTPKKDPSLTTKSKRPVLLLAKRKSVTGYQQSYFDTEEDAITKAGFETMELEAGIFGLTKDPDYDLTDRPVFCRHYANEDSYFVPYVVAHNGHLVVPDYVLAQEWYKILPLDFIARDYMGGRRMGWYSLKPYRFLEEIDELKGLKHTINEAFNEYSVNGKVFAKSETKNSFTAKLYTKQDLFETLHFLLGVGCHRTPGELIVSQPMPVQKIDTDYKLKEYRCLIVDNKVSTISLYTDTKQHRDYDEVEQFATRFARQFERHLPNSYDLDVARLADGKLAVVELNDISACGFYADHDIYKFYRDVYKLALKSERIQTH